MPTRTRSSAGCGRKRRSITTRSTTSLPSAGSRTSSGAWSIGTTYISGRGGILELIKANIEMPPGTLIFEDPPVHTVHRQLLSRVFTPKKMSALEPQIREFCARALDPLVGLERVRLHRRSRRPDADARDRHAPRHPRRGPGGRPGQGRRQSPHRTGPTAGLLTGVQPRSRASKTTSPGGPSTPPTTS